MKNNRNTLFLVIVLYFLIIAVGGLLLFAKQSPIAWDKKTTISYEEAAEFIKANSSNNTLENIVSDCICLGENCCNGKQIKPSYSGSPFIEKYAVLKSDRTYDLYENKYANNANHRILLYGTTLLILSGLLWVTFIINSRNKNG